MNLPVFKPLAIAVQKAVAIGLLIVIAAAFAGTITSFGFTVKVRAFRIIGLSTPAIICAGEHAIVVTNVVGALAVVIIRIVRLRINDCIVVDRDAIAIVGVSMPVSVTIAVTVAVPIAIVSTAGIAAAGISTRIATGAAGRRWLRRDHVAGLLLNYAIPIASIATAIAVHRATAPSVAAIAA